MATQPPGGEPPESHARITVVMQSRHTLDRSVVTGRELKETASIPDDFSLHRRGPGGTEAIADDQSIEVRNGDHFYAQPVGQAVLGHRGDR